MGEDSNRKGTGNSQPGDQSKAQVLDQKFREISKMLASKGLSSYEVSKVEEFYQDKAEHTQLQDLNEKTGKDFKTMEDAIKSYKHAEPNAALNQAIKQLTQENPGKTITVDIDPDGRATLSEGRATEGDKNDDRSGEEDSGFQSQEKREKNSYEIQLENDSFFNVNPDANLIKDRLMSESAASGKTVAELFYNNPAAYKDSIQLAKISAKSDDENQTDLNQRKEGEQSKREENEGEDDDGPDAEGIHKPPTPTWNV